MAESYTTGGTCDVGTFDSAIQRGADLRTTWGQFCDCMFLRPVETVTSLGNGEFQVSSKLEPTPDWWKCQTGFCANPGGCYNPRTKRNDPFDIGIGISFAPWTDLGTAGRNIPKRNAGVIYVVGEVFSIRPADYLPLEMWKTYFTNPALYFLRVAKIGLVPGIGQWLPPALLSFPGNLVPLGGLALTQLAAEKKDFVRDMLQPAVRGSVNMAAMLLKAFPAAMGNQVFTCIGILVQQYSRDQIDTGEINKIGGTSPDANVEFLRSLIRFFAAKGEDLGREIDKAIYGGLSIESAPGVINIISYGLQTIVNSPPQGMSPQARQILDVTAKAMYCIYIFTDEMSHSKGPGANQTVAEAMAQAGDRIVKYLFGVDLPVLRTSVQQGSAAVKASWNNATNKKVASFNDGVKLIDELTKALNAFARVVRDIDQAIGGGVLKLAEQFNQLSAAFAPIANETKVIAAQAADLQAQPTGTPALTTGKVDALTASDPLSTRTGSTGTSEPVLTVLPLTPTTKTPPKQGLPVLMSIPPTKNIVPVVVQPPTPNVQPAVPVVKPNTGFTVVAPSRTSPIAQPVPVAKAATNNGLAVGGVAIGFVAGGPVGAAIGGAVGLLLGKK